MVGFIKLGYLESTDRRCATQLHYILVMLCRDKAAGKRRNLVEKENGLDTLIKQNGP